mgnify:CR=1 FL=1
MKCADANAAAIGQMADALRRELKKAQAEADAEAEAQAEAEREKEIESQKKKDVEDAWLKNFP